MPQDLAVSHWTLDLKTFQGFYNERPKEEKWELIGGRPVMMPPPTLDHQKISGVCSELLNAQLAKSKPIWEANTEIGLVVPEDDTFNPEPDVTVIDADTELGQIYATRFYFVVEVRSPNDKGWVLEAKLRYYSNHASCSGVMFVNQDRIAAELYLRADNWSKADLSQPDDRIDIPGIGDIGPLAELYRRTRLYPKKSLTK
jgi:Uma2 family endonuclease